MGCSIGPIEAFMTSDHVRLDRLLARADRDGRSVDAAAFDALRRGLQRHIAMEERVLLPLVRARLGRPLPSEKVMRDDHARLATLLAGAPTPATCERLRELLGSHDPLEEGPGGLYARCDALARADAGELLSRLRATRAVSRRSPETESPARDAP
jgi:hypothetical protein